MITPDYVRAMARYNAWQNRQLIAALKDAPDEVLRAERGAFFGSIMGTLNHLLFGDTLWMNRFEPRISAPARGLDHLNFTPNVAVWSTERARLDGEILAWADAVSGDDLNGDLRWNSIVLERDFKQNRSRCVVHMFNHQTHHRGQVHAMMTSVGLRAPVSDVILMPEDE